MGKGHVGADCDHVPLGIGQAIYRASTQVSRCPTALHAVGSGCFGLVPTTGYRAHVTQQQHQLGECLPPLAAPDASDDERARAIEARMVARHGAPSIEDYRRAYDGFGAEWPGEQEIRRRHLVAPNSVT